METPTICALNGGAAGYGMDTALGCDIRIMAKSAKLAAAFCKRGLVPESGGTWYLPRLIGWSRAAELIFTGRTLSADESVAWGLASEVVANEELMPRARAIAAEIAGNAPLAVRAAKRMMRMGLNEPFPGTCASCLSAASAADADGRREGRHDGLYGEARASIQRQVARVLRGARRVATTMMRGLIAQDAARGTRGMARALLALLLLLVLSLMEPPLRAAELNGGYDGIGEAAGMALTLSEAERRVVGRLAMPSGVAYTLNGERAEVASGSAQGALRVSGAAQNSAFFHIEERPLGLQFLFIPAKADGTPDLGSSREYSFLKRGVRPTLSPDARKSYRDAPEGPVDIVAFVDGFRGWSPRDVARLYASLAPTRAVSFFSTITRRRN